MMQISNIFSMIANGAGAAADGSSASTVSFGSIVVSIISWIGNRIWGAFSRLFLLVGKLLLRIVEFFQFFAGKLTGIDTWSSKADAGNVSIRDTDVIFRFLFTNEVRTVFYAILGISILLLIIFTIVAIFKTDYTAATDTEGKATGSKMAVMKKTGKSLFLMLVIPVILLFGILGSNAVLASLSNAIKGDSNVSLGGTVFTTSAYNANLYRQYANDGKRVAVGYGNEAITHVYVPNKGDDALGGLVTVDGENLFVAPMGTEDQSSNWSKSFLNKTLAATLYSYYTNSFICDLYATYDGTGSSRTALIDKLSSLGIVDSVDGTAESYVAKNTISAVGADGKTRYVYVGDAWFTRAQWGFGGVSFLSLVVGSKGTTNVYFRLNYDHGPDADRYGFTDAEEENTGGLVGGAKTITKNGTTITTYMIPELTVDGVVQGWSHSSAAPITTYSLGYMGMTSYSDHNIIDAVYNAWDYNEKLYRRKGVDFAKTYYTAVSEDQNSSDYIPRDILNLDANARIYHNSENFPFDGKFVAMAEEYYVMADFVDWAIDTREQFYIVNASNGLIAWTDASLGQNFGKYVGTSENGKGAAINNLRVDGFAVQYSSGATRYYKCSGKDDEYKGETFILCKWVEGKYVPITTQNSSFASYYLANDYCGPIVARGVFSDVTKLLSGNENGSLSLFASHHNPTYISKTSVENVDDVAYYGFATRVKDDSGTGSVIYHTYDVVDNKVVNAVMHDEIDGTSSDYQVAKGKIVAFNAAGNELDHTVQFEYVKVDEIYVKNDKQYITLHFYDAKQSYLFSATVYGTKNNDGLYESNLFDTSTIVSFGGINFPTIGMKAKSAPTATQYLKMEPCSTKWNRSSETYDGGEWTDSDGAHFITLIPNTFDSNSTFYIDKSAVDQAFESDSSSKYLADFIKFNGENFRAEWAGAVNRNHNFDLLLQRWHVYKIGNKLQFDLVKTVPINTINVRNVADDINFDLYKDSLYYLDFYIDVDDGYAYDPANHKPTANAEGEGADTSHNYVNLFFHPTGKVMANPSFANWDDYATMKVTGVGTDICAWEGDSTTAEEQIKYIYFVNETIEESYGIDFAIGFNGIAAAFDKNNQSSFFYFRFKFGWIYAPDNSEPVYHLTSGSATLDYNFRSATGIDLDQLYEAGDINYIILLIAAVMLFTVIGRAVWGLIKRIYDIVLLSLMYPAVCATLPIDEKGTRFNSWKETLVKAIFGTYGIVLGIDLFFVLLPIVKDITTIFKPEDIPSSLKSSPLFGDAAFLNKLIYIMFLLVLFTLIKTLPALISKIVGGDNVYETGVKTKEEVGNTIKAAGNVMSGQIVIDGAQKLAGTAKNFLPGVALWGPIAAGAASKVGSAVSGLGSRFASRFRSGGAPTPAPGTTPGAPTPAPGTTPGAPTPAPGTTPGAPTPAPGTTPTTAGTPPTTAGTTSTTAGITPTTAGTPPTTAGITPTTAGTTPTTAGATSTTAGTTLTTAGASPTAAGTTQKVDQLTPKVFYPSSRQVEQPAEQTIQQIKPIDTAVEKPRENAQEGSNTAERPAENATEPASNNLTAGAKPDQAQTNESEPKAPAVGAINAKAFEIQNDINDDSKNARLTRIENEIKKKEKEINKLEKLIKEGKSKRGELESQISAQRNSFDEQKRKYDDLTNEVRKLKEEFRVQKSRTKNLGRKREEKPEQNDNSGDAGEPK